MTSEIKQRTVYQIVRTDKPDDGTDVYVGSTSQSLRKRLWVHRAYTKISNSKFYTRMREVGIYNWKIKPLLTFACNQKTIREFEKTWVVALNADLNTFSSFANNYETRCRQTDMKLFHRNIRDKVHHCNIYDMSFGWKIHLKQHLKSSRHFWNYIYSVD